MNELWRLVQWKRRLPCLIVYAGSPELRCAPVGYFGWQVLVPAVQPIRLLRRVAQLVQGEISVVPVEQWPVVRWDLRFAARHRELLLGRVQCWPAGWGHYLGRRGPGPGLVGLVHHFEVVDVNHLVVLAGLEIQPWFPEQKPPV